MASIGLSKPIVALYNVEGATVTYSNPAVVGKATTLTMELEDQDTNILYGDNGIAESANDFGGGSITLGTTELSAADMVKILGAEEVEADGVTWTVFNDNQNAPYCGLGAVAK